MTNDAWERAKLNVQRRREVWCSGGGETSEYPTMCGSLDPKLKDTLAKYTGHVICRACGRSVKAKRALFTKAHPGHPSIVSQCRIPAHKLPTAIGKG